MKLKVALVSIAGLAIVSIAGLARFSFAADASTSSAIVTEVLSWYDDATPQIVEKNLQNATEALTSQEQQQQLANTYNAAVVARAAKEKDDRTARAKDKIFEPELSAPCVLKFNGKAEVGGIAVSISDINFCEMSLVAAAIVFACKKEKLAECAELVRRAVKAHLEKEMKEAVAEPAGKGPNAEEKADLKGASRPPWQIRAAKEEAARMERESRGPEDPKARTGEFEGRIEIGK